MTGAGAPTLGRRRREACRRTWLAHPPGLRDGRARRTPRCGRPGRRSGRSSRPRIGAAGTSWANAASQERRRPRRRAVDLAQRRRPARRGCAMRSGSVAKRGSSASSGCPSAAHVARELRVGDGRRHDVAVLQLGHLRSSSRWSAGGRCRPPAGRWSIAASGHRNAMPASSMASSMCWPSAWPALAGEQRGGDRLGRRVRRDLVAERACGRAAGSPVAGLVCTLAIAGVAPGSRCRRRGGWRTGPCAPKPEIDT